ncbi:MAG TPA: SRPBCC domain-containing protein [Thermohalobaculum sp.]|nr:SRPBCC domain-containing protein [Thermohalobaculum sp.]
MNMPATNGTTDDTTLMIRRSYDADAATLFRALTDPEAIKEWFGPGVAKVRHASSDLRVGGKWAIEMIGDNCEEHNVSGEYVEIDAPRKVVFTWAWRSTPDKVSQVTYALSPAGEGRTNLTLTHERLANAEVRDKHGYGWNGALDKLAPWLAR